MPGESSLDILLAEDNPVSQMVANALLTRRGHRVTVAKDGSEAVCAVENGRFDAILMDVQMPVMDGLEATRTIRRLPDGKGRLPIIAMTASAAEDDAARCLAAGMDGHIAKPLDAGRVMEMLKPLLGRGE